MADALECTVAYEYFLDGKREPIDERVLVVRDDEDNSVRVIGSRVAHGTELRVAVAYGSTDPDAASADRAVLVSLEWIPSIDTGVITRRAEYVLAGTTLITDVDDGDVVTVNDPADGDVATLPEGSQLFALLRIFSGPVVIACAKSHASAEPASPSSGSAEAPPLESGERSEPTVGFDAGADDPGSLMNESSTTVIVPDVRDPSKREQLFMPLVDRRTAEVVGTEDVVVERATSADEVTEATIYRYVGGSYGEQGAHVVVDDGGLMRRYAWDQPEVGHWDVRLAEVTGTWPRPLTW